MIRDPIVDEVREARRRTEEACEGDWNRLVEHYRAVPARGARIIRGQPKRKAPVEHIDTPA